MGITGVLIIGAIVPDLTMQSTNFCKSPVSIGCGVPMALNKHTGLLECHAKLILVCLTLHKKDESTILLLEGNCTPWD